MKRVRAGVLQHRITIQQQTEVQDSAGDVTLTWADLYTGVEAQFLPAKGREYVAGDSVRNELPAKFIIRRIEGLDARLRVLWDGQTWFVEDVMPDTTARNHLTLTVTRNG